MDGVLIGLLSGLVIAVGYFFYKKMKNPKSKSRSKSPTTGNQEPKEKEDNGDNPKING